jgi:phosphoribosylformimino-5-aminoimidazole carboxamide ribotide isomerase
VSTQILPAIDILAGRVVRLRQGSFDEVTVYNNDPVDQAKRFEAAGAEMIHVVDLDGALLGEPVNLASIEAIVSAIGIPIQVGGGIRSDTTMQRLHDAGVERMVLGTAIINDPALVRRACFRWPGVVAGVDARAGRVAIEGWKQGTEFDVTEVVAELGTLGVRRLVYTDIAMDGMSAGPNLAAYRSLLAATDVAIIASGGVTTIADIRALSAMEGIEAIIVGRALYEGSMTLQRAIAAGHGEA